MSATSTRDQVLQKFAAETDASADLGSARDAADRMADIHTQHDAALAPLRSAGHVRVQKVRKAEVKTVGI